MAFASRERQLEYMRAYNKKRRTKGHPQYLVELARSRAQKERYRGLCSECGESTNGANGPGTAATLCGRCNGRKSGLARRGAGKRQRQLIAFLREAGSARFSEIRAHLNIESAHTSVLLNHSVRSGLVERVSRGVYRVAPASTTSSPAALPEGVSRG